VKTEAAFRRLLGFVKKAEFEYWVRLSSARKKARRQAA